MPKPAANIARNFVGHLKYLEQTRSKMERLASTGHIVRRDIEQVYLGLFIDAMTSFENLIEELFIGILVGRIEMATRIVPRISFETESSRVAREVLLGGRNYLDWFPYEETEKRAKAFLRKGLPFTCLTGNEKAKLRNLNYIRNAIAHQSSFSKRRFKKVIKGLPLTLHERTPAGFLRSKIRIAPDQTRYENFAIQLADLAIRLSR